MHKSLPFAALLVGIVAASFACVKTAVSVDIGLCAMDCLLDACDSARGFLCCGWCARCSRRFILGGCGRRVRCRLRLFFREVAFAWRVLS